MQEKPQYKRNGGLPQKMRVRLTSAARCAIKMRSQEPDVAEAVKKLKKDLQNGPYHCFGQHSNCSADFCRTAREKQRSSDFDNEDGNLDDIDDLIQGRKTCSNKTNIIL